MEQDNETEEEMMQRWQRESLGAAKGCASAFVIAVTVGIITLAIALIK